MAYKFISVLKACSHTHTHVCVWVSILQLQANTLKPTHTHTVADIFNSKHNTQRLSHMK